MIDGRYVEVNPPHRIVIAWDRTGTYDASPTLVEITFTPTGGNTNMTVEFIARSAEDADFYGEICRDSSIGSLAQFLTRHPPVATGPPWRQLL